MSLYAIEQAAAVADLCEELDIPFEPQEWTTCKHGRVRKTINGRRYEVDSRGEHVYSTEASTP